MTESDCEDSDEINTLPDELLLYIFRFLSLEEILSCEDVCQRWRKLALDSSLWKRITVVHSAKPNNGELNNKNLEILRKHSQYIRCIKLQYVYGYPYINGILEQCKNLISLELVMCQLSTDFENDITRWPNLRKINLKNTILMKDNQDLVIQYDQFQDLTYLALAEFGLNSKNCNSLLGCRYLVHIFIEKIKNLSLDFVTQLIACKIDILKSLHIYGGNAVDDHCLRLLSQCPLLEDLAVVRCENLTDEGLIALVNLKNIRHLQIWNNTMFTEANLKRTLSSPTLIKLQSLSLSRIGNISPVIVDLISECYRNLKFLAVYQCAMIVNTDYEKQLKSKFRNIDVVLY